MTQPGGSPVSPDGDTARNGRAPWAERNASALARYLPILEWGRNYNGAVLTNDMVAAVIVTIMLIPQSLAYALLAGLPPVVGLYASILPLCAYAVFGTSRTLAVGPVAVVSLMTASAVGAVAAQGTALYLDAAITLAALSGVMLLGYATLAITVARAPSMPRGGLWVLIVGNFAWALASLGLLLGSTVTPTLLGQAYLLVHVVSVAMLAELQWMGVRRLPGLASA